MESQIWYKHPACDDKVVSHPWVTVTLTSDLVSRSFVESGAYLIFFEVGIPNLVYECSLGWQSVAYHLWVTVTLTSDLGFRIIVSGAYLLYYLS